MRTFHRRSGIRQIYGIRGRLTDVERVGLAHSFVLPAESDKGFAALETALARKARNVDEK